MQDEPRTVLQVNHLQNSHWFVLHPTSLNLHRVCMISMHEDWSTFDCRELFRDAKENLAYCTAYMQLSSTEELVSTNSIVTTRQFWNFYDCLFKKQASLELFTSTVTHSQKTIEDRFIDTKIIARNQVLWYL